MLQLRNVVGPLLILFALTGLVYEPMARADSYTVDVSDEISGETFLAMRVAAEEFERQLPQWNIRDFDISVLTKPDEISVLFQHKDAPRDERGSNDATPSYSVILTPDGTRAMGLYTPR